MNDSDIWAARRAANAQHGDRLFDERSTQRALRYEKHGNTIFDSANELNLAYYFPSAVGAALFYYGHFEIGEISFFARLLASLPEPVILDVGANIGTHSLEWARLLPSAKVYAFEPSADNIELLIRNVEQSGLGERVTVVPSAVGDKLGTATFFETDDAAYSSLHDTLRRPVISQYSVELTTIDTFVQVAGLRSVSLIKIDVEGTEDAVIAGASETIGRFKPLLFIEVYGGANSNPNPKRTIETLVNLGYVPHLVSDGIVTPYEGHDDAFYNYLFVPESWTLELPPPDLRQKRYIDAGRLELIDKLTADLQKASYDVLSAQQKWEELDRSVQEKDASLLEKDASLQEKDASLQEKDASLQEKDASLQEKDASLQEKDASLQEKDASLQEKDASIQEKDASLQEKDISLQEKDRRIQDLSIAAAGLEVQLQAKDRLIAELTAATEALRSKLGAANEQVRAKDDLLLQFDADMREKDALIERLSAEVAQNSAQISDVYAQLQEKQASLEPIYAEMEMLRTTAQERLETVNNLDEVARERLAVIDSLTEQLAERRRR